MKKLFLILLSSLYIFLFSGCRKDKCENTYTLYYPVYKTLRQVRNEMKSGNPQPLQQTGKLYIYGSYIFQNEVNKGIHIIDNTNPAQPQNISFINIPGNIDLAVKGTSLYADSYGDLVVFDISDPAAVTAKKFVDNVFPDRAVYYSAASSDPDAIQVVVGYTQKDTVVDCETYRASYGCSSCPSAVFNGAMTLPVSKGGSMARFALLNDYLYTVTNSSLYSFNVTNAADPQLANKKAIGWRIETISPFRDRLFIGSNTGMFIFSTANASDPSLLGQFGHATSCDPVIGDDTHAYVTLRTGTVCANGVNVMEVLDITDVTKPFLVKSYPLTNPHGLAKDDDLLFVCDGKDGLKVYNAADPAQLQLIKTVSGLETFDVIANNGTAFLVARDGLYQFDYTDRNHIRQVSKIGIVR